MVNKIDSNVTGLSYAEEQSLGVLPATPEWNKLEPNSYNDFGGQLTTIARNPINPTRQRKKGVVTDLAASGGFNTDLTQTNLLDILQGFFFADTRAKGNHAVSAVLAADDSYAIASTLRHFVGTMIFASGFTNSLNNGLHTIDAVTANTKVSVEDGRVDETPPSTAKVQVVGFHFTAGQVSATNPGSAYPHIDIVSGLTSASKVFTLTDVDDLDSETVTIAGTVYTFQSALSTGPTIANEVLIGANIAAAVTNLNAAINGAAGVGTTYSVGTVANAYVSSVTNGTSTVTVTARTAGASGNALVIGETTTDGSWAGAAVVLSGGTGVGFNEMGLIAGEWVYVGGDGGTDTFVADGNNGFARINAITDSRLTFDKTQGTMVTEAAGSLTIALFFGDVLRNEFTQDLIVRRSYNLERQLGNDGNGIMSEYLVGAIPNTLAINIATANKITADLAFIATNNEQYDGTTGPKDGDRPALVNADAFNTSSDFARLKMTLLDPATANTTALFAYLTELTLNINNNCSPNKAVSVLGAFDVTAGTFEVSGSVKAYFADVAAVQAVRDNADVSIDFAVVKANAGLLFDVPLLALGDGRLAIEADQPVTLPLTMAAAESAFGYTLLLNSFPYLPDIAE